MTAFTLGEATALALGRVPPPGRAPGMAALRVRPPARSGAPHPTGAPIRRDSIEAGTFEEHFFAVPAKGEPDRLLRLARAALDAGRRLKRAVRMEGRILSPAEAALAGLTAGAVRVYEEICTLARLNRGRVFPSYDRLAEATALGRATVARALRALELAGFLVRQRRFKRVARAEGDGSGDAPRYAQTSNAYRPLLPARLLPHLPRWLSPAPLPVDVEQRTAERAAEVAAMHDSLSCRELAQTLVGGSLGRVLAKLGAHIDRRETVTSCESQNQPQPLLDSICSRKSGVGLVGRHVGPDGQTR
ncbi:helix-turn-helix domain-containing protein [Sphingomonas sp. IC4-52]|uniref:helix-turn-helix domain-containing protein n=1 Tax=Sphingomonas sp. IC4-52 TaxID=2887202 RepID=UPI001D106C52|nr:helix-turn-helix domain-containing protein [Sphingomonas sp. IC4-52]MCC2981681.1 helix-turn-helix domain-containing protein [Sphingomonas sp. IC4-52]